MNQKSMSNVSREGARPWLELHYQETRQRTVRLVKAAVDQLVKEGQSVTIEAICKRSQQLDLQGKGIKKAGILGNEPIIDNTVLCGEVHQNALHSNQ